MAKKSNIFGLKYLEKSEVKPIGTFIPNLTVTYDSTQIRVYGPGGFSETYDDLTQDLVSYGMEIYSRTYYDCFCQ